MPQGPDFRQYLDQALQLGTLTRAQAQKMTKDLVREGQLAQERAQTYVDELVERSRKRTESVVGLIRDEVKAQIAALGMATKDDIARLEKRIAQFAAPKATPAPATMSNPGPELPLGDTTAVKTPVRKAAVQKRVSQQAAGQKAVKKAVKKASPKGGG